ncbi:hypothetical protein FQN54_000775 [Arachnomyces sp. PD_36]|nr:hypothetical protein FQN54_000775 [Arachnomyces sp. PD_36]
MRRLFRRSRANAGDNLRGNGNIASAPAPAPTPAPAPAPHQPAGVPFASTYGHSPGDSGINLHDAAAKGLEQSIRRLLGEGVPVDALNSEGSTALQVAIRQGHERVVKLLLDSGADVNYPRGSTSETPVFLASYSMNPALMATVLSHRPNLESGDGMTPLLVAVSVGDEDVVRLLLQAGANIRARTAEDGHTVLHMAVTYFKQSLLPLLLKSGATVDASSTNPPGLTALHLAAQVGNEDALRELIKAGANLFAKYSGRLTALHAAAGDGRVGTASILLDHGLDILPADPAGIWGTPMGVTVIQNKEKMLLFFLHRVGNSLSEEMKIGLVTAAAGTGHLGILEILHKQGFDLHGRDGFDETGLSLAASCGHRDVVIFLLKKGADPSQRCRRNTATAIEMATQAGHYDIVRLLQDAQRQRAQSPNTVLFPEWAGDRSTTIYQQAEFKATFMSVSATSTISPNQDPGGTFNCYACRNLDFRRGMSADANVVYFLPMPALRSCKCKGCQFLQNLLQQIKNVYGEGLWNDKQTSAPTFQSINLWNSQPCSELTLQSMGQGMPLLLHADNFPSKTSRRIEIFVERGSRDAIIVTRSLGVKYLWIDSLCILQDSEDDWRREAAKMQDIYAKCYAMIAADDSPDAHGGLFTPVDGVNRTKHPVCGPGPGFSNVNAYFRLTHLRDPFHMEICHRIGDETTLIESSRGRLNQRGWALQERVLAPRVLHFGRSEFAWECSETLSCECQLKPTALDRESRFKALLVDRPLRDPALSGKADILLWTHIVQEFTQRKLSYDTDILYALSGLASHMAAAAKAEYACGIWKEPLAEFLMWTVIHEAKISTFSDKLDNALSTQPFGLEPTSMPPHPAVNIPVPPRRHEAYYAPTWSWASIIGPIKFTMGRLDLNGRDQVSHIRKDGKTERNTAHRKSLLGEVKISYYPIDDDALKQFGPPPENSSLTIHGKTAPVTWTGKDKSPYGYLRSQNGGTLHYTYAPHLTAAFEPDVPDQDSDVRLGDHFLLLYVITYERSATEFYRREAGKMDAMLEGLVLTPVPMGVDSNIGEQTVYRRVGIFETDDSPGWQEVADDQTLTII